MDEVKRRGVKKGTKRGKYKTNREVENSPTINTLTWHLWKLDETGCYTMTRTLDKDGEYEENLRKLKQSMRANFGRSVVEMRAYKPEWRYSLSLYSVDNRNTNGTIVFAVCTAYNNEKLEDL